MRPYLIINSFLFFFHFFFLHERKLFFVKSMVQHFPPLLGNPAGASCDFSVGVQLKTSTQNFFSRLDISKDNPASESCVECLDTLIFCNV